jgi:hypothetical protein
MTVAEIEVMDRAALLAAWVEIFGAPAPKNLSQIFLRRFLAFEVQARRQGGLPARVRRELTRDGATQPKPKSPALKPGGRLIREWNGVSHVVDVAETGFDWRGQRYRSLSAIAREITGAHWSGPRFFGLGGKDRP